MKPLFIPLKTEYFEAFKAGLKTTEFRPYGARWNERTCPIGRQVVLSKGYGKRHRLYGVVVDFRRSRAITRAPVWREIYGDKFAEAACIRVALPQSAPQTDT